MYCSYNDVYHLDILTTNLTLIYENTQNLSAFYFDNSLRLRLARRSTADGGDEYLRAILEENYANILEYPSNISVDWVSYRNVSFENSDTTRMFGFDITNENVYWSDSEKNDKS